MGERWDRARVLALAPDASSLRAAQPLASGRSWPLTGAAGGAADGAEDGTADRGADDGAKAADGSVLWGECLGSAAAPYRTAVDLSGPAYRCSCPSRKFPCKHALALLLLWSDGVVAAGGDPPEWVRDWLASREAAASARRRSARPDACASTIRAAMSSQCR